jgi:hypothetical protein
MELLRFALIHVLVPAAGVVLFFWLVSRMFERQIENPPVFSLFIIFATWGSLLVLILTRFFLYWSGMSTVGLLYLVFLAPIVMFAIAVRCYLERKLSRFHMGALVASISYIPVLVGVLIGSNLWGFPFK